MNMLFRMFWFMFFGGSGKRLRLMDKAETSFRVWPTDLDILMHMNNGKYLSLMDLGRIDLMQRCGAAKVLKANKIFPVVAAETIHFRKSLKLFN
jgi:acyl-CoA thioesterase FadM